MSTQENVREALALPLTERVALAQSLWQSIESQPAVRASDEIAWAVQEADRRDKELSSGQATGRTHEQVMRAVRKVLE